MDRGDGEHNTRGRQRVQYVIWDHPPEFALDDRFIVWVQFMEDRGLNPANPNPDNNEDGYISNDSDDWDNDYNDDNGADDENGGNNNNYENDYNGHNENEDLDIDDGGNGNDENDDNNENDNDGNYNNNGENDSTDSDDDDNDNVDNNGSANPDHSDNNDNLSDNDNINNDNVDYNVNIDNNDNNDANDADTDRGHVDNAGPSCSAGVGGGIGVSQAVEQSDPLLGGSKKRLREDGQDSDDSCKRFRWWDECDDIDNLSDNDSISNDNVDYNVNIDTDNTDNYYYTDNADSPVENADVSADTADDDPLPGPSRKRSREDDTVGNEERTSKKSRPCNEFANSSSDTKPDRTGHDVAQRSCKIELAEEKSAVRQSEEEATQQEEEEEAEPQPGCSRKRSRDEDDDEDEGCSKRLRY